MSKALHDNRVAELNVSFSGGILSASCKIEGDRVFWRSQPVNMKVDLSGLDGKISQLKQVLTEDETGIWAGLQDPLGKPNPGLVRDKFKACMERVVSKGSALYKELSELGLSKILNQIDTILQEGDRLSIQTDCAFFPWEILYPFPYDTAFTDKQKEDNPLRRNQLWGYKFMTEYILLPLPEEENGWTAPIDEHERGVAFVSFNLNKDIEGDFSNRPFKPINFQREFFASCIHPRGNWHDSADQIQEFLNSDNDATLIYLFCHGNSGSPLTGTEGEELELAKQKLITPNTLNLPCRYKCGPIIILNSCTSAAVSPLSFSSFHKKFRQKRAMGIIGTTIKIPTTFAAAFGRELIKSYLATVPIGRSIYDLRRNLLDLDNPLGLFYSLQCPGHITAPRGSYPCPSDLGTNN